MASHGNSRAITAHSPPDICARSRSFPPRVEFDLVMKVDDSLDNFSYQWEQYENAIISYCKAGSSKPAYLQQVFDFMDEDDPGKLP